MKNAKDTVLTGYDSQIDEEQENAPLVAILTYIGVRELITEGR